jgi:competence protein ComGE
MIVSLGIWLMIGAVLLPSFIQISLERKNTELKRMAQQILNEELRTYDFAAKENNTIERNHVIYTIHWEFEEDGIVKACVRWQDYTERLVERCGYTKENG